MSPFAFFVIFLLACVAPTPHPPPDDTAARAVSLLEARHADVLPSSAAFVATTLTEDALGRSHVRVAHTLGGVPVFESEAIVHLDADGDVLGVTDHLRPALDVDPQPSVAAAEARQIARLPRARADLWIVRHDGQPRLAWRLRDRVDGPTPSRPVVFVDAHDGAIVWVWDDLHTGAAVGSGDARYDGDVPLGTWKKSSKYYLEDSVRGAGTYSYGHSTTKLAYLTDSDDVWRGDPTAVQVQFGVAATLDHLSGRFGRDGIDGAGGPGTIASLSGTGDVLSAFVHYDTDYANAFWADGAATFGDGDGVTLDAPVSLDIVAHELAHGLTEATAGLTYDGESGGLNESMSDVFGAMVEAEVEGLSSDTWAIGEAAATPGMDGDALRWMDDPAADGVSLDLYSEAAATADVHHSSGIGNLSFYLVAEGGAHPRLGGAPVSGVGTDAAEQIWYRALTTYMTSDTDFAGARTATLAAAADLYGAASAEVVAVGEAWAAVGVSPDACAGYDTTNTGSLTTSDAAMYVPDSAGFALADASTQTAWLQVPAGADFDVSLQKVSGSSWRTVKTAAATSGDELLTYAGRSGGTFRYRVRRTSGSGAFTLCSSAE